MRWKDWECIIRRISHYSSATSCSAIILALKSGRKSVSSQQCANGYHLPVSCCCCLPSRWVGWNRDAAAVRTVRRSEKWLRVHLKVFGAFWSFIEEGFFLSVSAPVEYIFGWLEVMPRRFVIIVLKRRPVVGLVLWPTELVKSRNKIESVREMAIPGTTWKAQHPAAEERLKLVIAFDSKNWISFGATKAVVALVIDGTWGATEKQRRDGDWVGVKWESLQRKPTRSE